MAGVPNVANFQGMLGKWGLQSPNKFLVEIKFPVAVEVGTEIQEWFSDGRNINLYCESASIAGRSLLSTVDRQYGRNREIVYNGPTYPPITLSFYCSEGLREKRQFDWWNEYIVNSQRGYDVAYYKDYIGTLIVHTLDRTGDVSHSMTYNECYPKTISAVELNHNTTNATARLTVEIQYSWWTHENKMKTDKLEINEMQSPASSLGERGF